MVLFILSSVESSSQVTRIRLGLDRAARSDWLSCRLLQLGSTGYTVKRQPHPLTEPSELNFHLSSSPWMRSSGDQSVHSRPERMATMRPVESIMVSGSWRRSVEH